MANTQVLIVLLFFTPPLVGERIIVMTVSVCMQAYLGNYISDLHQISVHVTYKCGLVLLCRRCEMLCTSGFMDGIIFAHATTATTGLRPLYIQCGRLS